MDNKDKIKKFAKELSLDTIGFTKCRVFEELRPWFEYRKRKNLFNEFEEQDIEKKINPRLLMEEGKTILSIAFPYYYNDDDNINQFSIYTRGIDYHKVVNDYLDKICQYIESLGGKAKRFVDSNPLPERYIASLCGIGVIGKNNTLITKKYGSYVFLGEIITDLELEPDEPTLQGCIGCNICMEKCPTSVIIKDGSKFNSNMCVSYLTQKKHLDKNEIPLIGGRIFGCDTCQSCCPHNKNIFKSPIKEFEPKKYMENIDLKSIIKINNAEFKEKYKNHSCGWRGKNILVRNSLINYYLINKTDNDNLYKDITSPYIKEYYEKLFDKLE